MQKPKNGVRSSKQTTDTETKKALLRGGHLIIMDKIIIKDKKPNSHSSRTYVISVSINAANPVIDNLALVVGLRLVVHFL